MRSLAPLLALALLSSIASSQSTVTLGADLDNSIYSAPANNSNGMGDHLFAGRTDNGGLRRGLLHFDIAGAVPAGSTIQAVSLRLYMSRTQANTRPISLHRSLQSWGEGASNAPGEEGGGTLAQAGDATWSVRFFPNDPWSSAGGSFDSTASATTPVDDLGYYTWNSAAMTTDLQSWLDSPSSNLGWFVIGVESQDETAKRFDTRNNSDAARRPELTITYSAGGCGSTIAASEVVRVGMPANPNALLPGTSAPLLGTTWDPRIDHTTFLPSATIDILVIGNQMLNVPSGFGTLLTNVAPPRLLFSGSAGSPFAVVIPNDCSLLGAQRSAQGASIDAVSGTVAVTNALDLVAGNV